jgi:hypothetical protein
MVVEYDFNGNEIKKYDSLKSAACEMLSFSKNKNFKSVYVILSRAVNNGETAFKRKWKHAE